MDILKIILRNLLLFVRNAVVFAVVLYSMVAIQAAIIKDIYFMPLVLVIFFYYSFTVHTPLLFILSLFGVGKEFYTSWKHHLLGSIVFIFFTWLLSRVVGLGAAIVLSYIITFLIMLAISVYRKHKESEKEELE